MQRLLYPTPLPGFYAQLDPHHPAHPDHAAHAAFLRGRRPQAHQDSAHARRRTDHTGADADVDVEKQLPPSNALEIGLEEVDEEEQARLDRRVRRDERTRPAKGDTAHTDVTRGGYPTFSGHGVNAPGRNVPAGYVEDERGGVRFVSEEAQRVRSMQARQGGVGSKVQDTRGRQATGEVVSVSDRENRDPRRAKPAPAPLNLPGPSSLRRPPARATSRDATLSTLSTGPPAPESATTHAPRQPNRKSRAAAVGNALTPIGETDEPSSAITSRSELRKSLQAATTDLGPHFPLPPSRSQSGDSVKTPMGASVSRARRESSVDSMAGAAPWAALASDPEAPVTRAMPTSPLKIFAAKSTRAIQAEPKSPCTPRAMRPGVGADRMVPPSPGGVDTRQPASRPVTMLRSSLAPGTRSPTTAVARTERVSRGVRFDLASPEAFSPASSVSTVTPGVVSPKNGIRVPGTSFTIPLPFSVPSTPRPQRQESVESVDTELDFSAARPESIASTASFDSLDSLDELSALGSARPEMVARGSSGDLDPDGVRWSVDQRAALQSRDGRAGGGRASGRPVSVAVLGGGYLDGGKEQTQRRRYSSIDSF